MYLNLAFTPNRPTEVGDWPIDAYVYIRARLPLSLTRTHAVARAGAASAMF
jgi:hypothetical protein